VNRVKAIRVQADGASTAARYRLTYGRAPDTGWSQLASVVREAVNGGGAVVIAVPTTTFAYQPPAMSFETTTSSWPSAGQFIADNTGLQLNTLDVNGDALPDRPALFTPPLRVRLQQNGAFGTEQTWPVAIQCSQGAAATNLCQWADLNGDGFPDLASSVNMFYNLLEVGGSCPEDCLWDVQFNTGAGFGATAQWLAPRWGTDPVDYSYVTQGQLRDIDGDSRADLLECFTATGNGAGPSEAHPYCLFHRNNGAGFDDPVEWYTPPTANQVPRALASPIRP
jgi:hypothetical protein